MLYVSFALILIVLLVSIKKHKKKLVYIIIILSILVFLLYINFTPLLNKNIIIKQSPSFYTNFNGIYKSYYVYKRYNKIYNVFVLREDFVNNEYIILSDNKKDYNIKLPFDDMGIDTVLFINDSIKFIIKNFSGKFKQCSLKVFFKQNDTSILIKKSFITMEDKDFQYAILQTNDYNKYNDYFYKNSKLNILILNKYYTRDIQEYINFYSALFPNINFYGAILRDNSIISSQKNIDGIILLDRMKLNTQYKTIVLNNKSIYNLTLLEYWIRTINSKQRIKNPFNPKDNIFKISFKDNILSFLKSFLPYMILLSLFAFCLILLF